MKPLSVIQVLIYIVDVSGAQEGFHDVEKLVLWLNIIRYKCSVTPIFAISG